MNSVSWFIYVAQVSQSIGSLFVGFGAVILICCVAYTVACAIEYGEARFARTRFFVLGATLLVIGNLMPHQNTMYAIAASQVGEQIVKTEIATDATKALHSWIKKQIEPASAAKN